LTPKKHIDSYLIHWK